MKKMMCFLLLCLAMGTGCPDEGSGTQVTPTNNKKDMEQDMPKEDMTEDMPEEDMKEDMPEEDMKQDMDDMMGSNLTGTWSVTKASDDSSVGELILTHETDMIPVTGTYKMAGTDETGDLGNATLLDDAFSVEWFTGPNMDQKHLINMATYGATTMSGKYISPTSGGLAEDVTLTKQ